MIYVLDIVPLTTVPMALSRFGFKAPFTENIIPQLGLGNGFVDNFFLLLKAQCTMFNIRYFITKAEDFQ